MRAPSTALAATALAAALAGCGGGGAKTFDEGGLTFTYPKDFKAGRSVGATPAGRVLGVVGLSRDDYIAARGQRSAPLPLEQLQASLPTVVPGVLPASVRLERHGKLTMVTATQRGQAPGVQSRIYFFNGKGKTWQLECRFSGARRSRIGAACDAALRSLRLK